MLKFMGECRPYLLVVGKDKTISFKKFKALLHVAELLVAEFGNSDILCNQDLFIYVCVFKQTM